ncbi:MAG: DUF2480 family protein [Bacteroidota bacterium]
MDLVNRVAQSDITTYNLEELWDGKPVVEFDLAPHLVEGLVLREVPFREAMKAHDWSQYDDHHVAVFCSTDAIVPTWAAMLVASKLEGVAASVAHGRKADLVRDRFTRALDAEDWAQFEGKPVVIKGCGSAIVPANAYLIATQKLQGVAKKLMYGEPCSSVPLWRKPKAVASKPAAAAKPAGMKPVGLPRPAAAKPVGIKPAGVKPAGGKPAEVKPASVKPAGVKPAGPKPVALDLGAGLPPKK